MHHCLLFFHGSCTVCVVRSVLSIVLAAGIAGCGSGGDTPAGDQQSEGVTRTVSWMAVPDPSVLGYKVYWGTSSHHYESHADVGPNVSYTVSGLRHGTTYFCAVSAYSSGGESGLSDEVSSLAD